MRPLTPGMLELLKAMKAGGKVMYSPYMGRFNPQAHYFCFELKGRHRCTREAEGLLSRGLAKKVNQKQYSNDHELDLTDDGRAFLGDSRA